MKDTKLDIFRKKEITDLAIVAHQDDAEIIGFNGIINSFESSRRKFGTIVVTNGSGAKKISKYLEMSKEDYINKRNQEQLKAATIGKYSFVNFLKYESSELITQKDNVINDLKLIVKKLNPQNIYIHHPLDPHKTHMILSRLTLEAIKLLPKENRLNKIYAINLWGNNQIYLGKKTSFDMTNNALLIKEL
ncbi:MAG: PIG-L family deacetylase, partial [Candidatus Izimaplasma sp.]|nr:PIG-L family deacetylase [Candidatus Izimaplasma bacterium]